VPVFIEEIEFLGYVVSKEGVRPNDYGIKDVKNFPVPKNIHNVQSFFGLSSYFRKFIENFAEISGSLYALLKKEAVFKFDH